MSLQSQKAAILAHLKAGKSITPKEAERLCGSRRLGGRIYDLRKEGHNIYREMVQVGPRTRVASYTLVTT